MSFHTSVTGTSVFSPTPNAFMGQTPALMIRRLAKPAAGSFTAIRLFCEIKQKNVNICLLFSGPYSHYTGGNLKTGFSLRTYQMFFVHTTSTKFENATITG